MQNFSTFDNDVQIGSRAVLAGSNLVDPATGEILNDEPGGLSTAHISTVSPEPEKITEPAIKAWVGGSLIKVNHGGPFAPSRVGGGKRKMITGFSRGSRRRLQRKIATIQRENLPVFVTLTYPDEFPQELQVWNLHLERLRSRLARKGWGAIWRKEFKRRKSGKNVGKIAPHYHLLIWGCALAELREYIGRAWWECCGKICAEHLEAGSRCELPRSWDGVAGYTSKYLAKADDQDVKDFLSTNKLVGRMWGVLNSSQIPWAECIEMTLNEKEVNTFFRYMRRYAHIQARSSWPSMTIFCRDPWQWLECVI